ncbi:hypothetical protein J2P12_03140, partial [Candidatus Bathyarchaeota archaeon]|nr:hypothetical protein [Candidatus Bathyarchaeota archaeon]
LISFYHFTLYTKTTDLSERSGLYKSALFLGLGIASKIYPLLLLPVLLKDLRLGKDRLVYMGVSVFPVLVFSLPFLASDPYSYLYMLTIKNVGGEHPLIGALYFSPLIELPILGVMAVALVWIYASRLPVLSRLALVFLWVNLATLSTTYQYMTWGIPFFILLIYENKSIPKILPFYPMIEVFSALVFNGFYNAYEGLSGPYYWMYPVLHEKLTVFNLYPLVGRIAIFLTPISVLVTTYYIVRLGSGKPQKFWTRLPHLGIPKKVRFPLRTDLARPVLPILLIFLTILSWTYVATNARYEAYSYPTINSTTFNTSFQFQDSILDYQLIFAGNGTYSITPGSNYVTLSSRGTNTSASIYRGWLSVREGFRPSNSATVSFRFKLDYFPPNAAVMNLATLSGGTLYLARNSTGTSFNYHEQSTGSNRTILSGDHQWHSFSANYTQQNTTVSLDNNHLTLTKATFNQATLGNENDSKPFGRVEYSDFQTTLRAFPTGNPLPLYGVPALGAPLATTILAFGAIPGGFLRRHRTRKDKEAPPDSGQVTRI